MKIKNQFILSHTLMSVCLIIVFTLLTHFVLKNVQKKNIEIAQKNIIDISSQMTKLSEENLRRFGETQVLLYAKAIANELAFELKKYPVKDYNTLRKSDKLRAIATQDLYSNLQKSGSVDVFDRKGEVIWHKNKNLEGRNYKEWEKEYPKMWELAQLSFTKPLVADYYSFLDENFRTRERYVAVVHVQDSPFNLYTIVNISDYFYPVEKKIESINTQSKETAISQIRNYSQGMMSNVFISLAIISVLFFILIFVISINLSYYMARPLNSLCKSVSKISSGEFTFKTKEEGSTEIRKLASDINLMGEKLDQYVRDLQSETAKRQVVESELAIASEIQQSILPRVFPPFPGRDEFDLYAIMHPAKEVGGDFYDFFFYDHHTFVFLVGDVSGKGIPAALFMMLCRTLLHSTASEIKEPHEVLKKVNKALSEDNDSNMFVTVFLAYYFIDTGKLLYSNAGHLPALVQKSTGEFTELTTPNSTAMGIVPDIAYLSKENILDINDKLILYTDGVTEATSPDNELYGFERMQKYFSYNHQYSSKSDCENILESLIRFQNDNQFDDITLSVFKRLK